MKSESYFTAESKISQNLRVYGFYRRPRAKQEPIVVDVLENMEKSGLVERVPKSSVVMYKPTDKFERSVVVKNVEAHKIRVGSYLGYGSDIIGRYNNTYFEVKKSTFQDYGFVLSVKEVFKFKSFFDMICLTRTKMLEFLFMDGSTLTVEPNDVFHRLKAV